MKPKKPFVENTAPLLVRKRDDPIIHDDRSKDLLGYGYLSNKSYPQTLARGPN